MTIAMPTIGYLSGRPKLMDPKSVSRFGNRAISFIEYGDPYWTIDVETQRLCESELADMEAWVATARGGLETVIFVPVTLQRFPRAYWEDQGNVILNNTGALNTITNGRQLNISSVTTGLVLTKGDLISLTSGLFKSLHRVTVGATAAASSTTVSVEPPVPSYITTGAVVDFKNQSLNTRIIPDTVDVGDGYFPTVKFQLIEVPR